MNAITTAFASAFTRAQVAAIHPETLTRGAVNNSVMVDKLTALPSPINPEALHPAIERSATFDPAEYIEAVLDQPRLKFELMSTITWGLDNQIIAAASAMYYDIRRENPDMRGEDEMTMLIDAFHGTYSNEGYWGEGTASKLAKLVSIQPQWQDLARRFAIIAGYDNLQIKSIDELLLTAKVSEIKPDTMTNMKANAEIVARETGMTIEEALADLVAQSKAEAQHWIDQKRKLIPAIRAIVYAARKHISPSVTFDALPTMSRLQIVRLLMQRTPAIRTRLGKFVSTADYPQVLSEAVNAQKVFTRVVDKLAQQVTNEQNSAD